MDLPGFWRVGRPGDDAGGLRTLFHQLGDKPSDEDMWIGVMQSPELARVAVRGYACLVAVCGEPQTVDVDTMREILAKLREDG